MEPEVEDVAATVLVIEVVIDTRDADAIERITREYVKSIGMFEDVSIAFCAAVFRANRFNGEYEFETEAR